MNFLTYLGDITDDGRVLDWLINNRATGDDGVRLEEVTLTALEGMVSTKEGIAVLFCKYHLLYELNLNRYTIPMLERHRSRPQSQEIFFHSSLSPDHRFFKKIRIVFQKLKI